MIAAKQLALPVDEQVVLAEFSDAEFDNAIEVALAADPAAGVPRPCGCEQPWIDRGDPELGPRCLRCARRIDGR
jgi:hypothetical protein